MFPPALLARGRHTWGRACSSVFDHFLNKDLSKVERAQQLLLGKGTFLSDYPVGAMSSATQRCDTNSAIPCGGEPGHHAVAA